MRVSVVMTVFNGEKYLQEAINSVLLQTYSDFEFVIVNDGSTDGTKNILNKIADPRVKIIHLDDNKGSVHGLNLAIENSSGQWIAIHDADDISHPRRLEAQLDYIKLRPNIVLLGSLIHAFSDDPSISEDYQRGYDFYWNYMYASEERMRIERLHGCPLCHGSVMFNREAFNKVGRYDPKYKIVYDYQLWIRMFEIGRVVKVPEVLYYYRIHSKSLSHKSQEDTGKEMMTIQTDYIRRRLFKNVSNPKFIMFGPPSGCKYYRDEIYPNSKISIARFLTNDFNKEYSAVIKKVKNGQIAGVIILDGPSSINLASLLLKNGLRLNRNLFRMHNRLYD